MEDKNECYYCGTPPVVADPNHEYYVCKYCTDFRAMALVILCYVFTLICGMWIGFIIGSVLYVVRKKWGI
jgi:hypothetical protein